MDEKNKNIAEFLDMVDRTTAPMEKQVKRLWTALLIIIAAWFIHVVYLTWPMPSMQTVEFEEAKQAKQSQIFNGQFINGNKN